jgi:hypothetical protein
VASYPWNAHVLALSQDAGIHLQVLQVIVPMAPVAFGAYCLFKVIGIRFTPGVCGCTPPCRTTRLIDRWLSRGRLLMPFTIWRRRSNRSTVPLRPWHRIAPRCCHGLFTRSRSTRASRLHQARLRAMRGPEQMQVRVERRFSIPRRAVQSCPATSTRGS